MKALVLVALGYFGYLWEWVRLSLIIDLFFWSDAKSLFLGKNECFTTWLGEFHASKWDCLKASIAPRFLFLVNIIPSHSMLLGDWVEENSKQNIYKIKRCWCWIDVELQKFNVAQFSDQLIPIRRAIQRVKKAFLSAHTRRQMPRWVPNKRLPMELCAPTNAINRLEVWRTRRSSLHTWKSWRWRRTRTWTSSMEFVSTSKTSWLFFGSFANVEVWRLIL